MSNVYPDTRSGSRIEEAQYARTTHHGRNLTLHSVIYPIDFCTSGCTYCGLSTLLSRDEHDVGGGMPPENFEWLLRELDSVGYEVHELVFGTVAEDQTRLAQRIARWVERAHAIVPAAYIIVNCDTLLPSGYELLKAAGADAIWTFMEVMSPELYAGKHLSGLKSDQLKRLEAPRMMRDAGLDVGNALLWGLVSDWRPELDQFLEYSDRVGGFDFVATPVHQEVTLKAGSTVPADFEPTPARVITPDDYLEIISELRLAFPNAHLVGNTRLDPTFIYSNASKIFDMCNGYVWSGSRSHPMHSFAKTGHIKSFGTQMNFFNPGVSKDELQELCGDHVDVHLDKSHLRPVNV